MRPIDTDALQAEIDQFESEKRDLDSEIDRLDTLEDRLPDLEAKQTDLDEQIEAKRARLEKTEADLDATDADVEETREDKDELDEFSDARSAVEEARLDIESERKSIAGLREEKEELETDLNGHPDEGEGETSNLPATQIDEIETDLKERRDRVQELETTINELQTIIGFNEDMLEGKSASTAVLNAFREGNEAEIDGDEESDRASALTDQLMADDETVCWTCGSEVEQDRIETTLDRLREVRSEYFEERRSLRDDIDELKSQKNHRKPTAPTRTPQCRG